MRRATGNKPGATGVRHIAPGSKRSTLVADKRQKLTTQKDNPTKALLPVRCKTAYAKSVSGHPKSCGIVLTASQGSGSPDGVPDMSSSTR